MKYTSFFTLSLILSCSVSFMNGMEQKGDLRSRVLQRSEGSKKNLYQACSQTGIVRDVFFHPSKGYWGTVSITTPEKVISCCGRILCKWGGSYQIRDLSSQEAEAAYWEMAPNDSGLDTKKEVYIPSLAKK
jgi:hypothetical protein